MDILFAIATSFYNAPVKNKLFYFEKWDLDKEHIISHLFSDTYENVNCIGNLLYLEKNINRSFGKRTSIFNEIKLDVGNKTSQTENHTINYRNSKLSSVKLFLKNYDEQIFRGNNILAVIEKRQNEKNKLFTNLFEQVLDANSQNN